MNGTMTREEVGREVDERLRMVNSRLTSLEALKPKAAMIAKAVDGHHHMETVELFDEGVSQGFGYQMDFVGSSVSAVRSGRRLTVTVAGVGGTLIFNEDAALVGTGATLNFTEPDATLLTIVGTTVTANTSLYALLSGRSGGQTIRGGTVDNTYLTLQGNSIDISDPVILASPLRMAASTNNYIQDSTGARALTFADDTNQNNAMRATFPGYLRVLYALGITKSGSVPAPDDQIFVIDPRDPNPSAGTFDIFLNDQTGAQLQKNLTFYRYFANVGAVQTNGFTMSNLFGILFQPTLSFTVTAGTTTSAIRPIIMAPILSGTVAGTVTNMGSIFTATVNAPAVVTNLAHATFNNPGGGGTITNLYAIDIAGMTAGATTNIGIRIAKASTYSLQLSSTDGTAAGGIQWGTDLANLYRSAVNTLKTDGDFICRTVNTGGGAFEVVAGQSIIDFGAFPGKSDTSLAVTGQTDIVAGSIIEVNLTPVATADHSADEHLVESLRVFAGAIVAGTGFTIYGRNDGSGDTTIYGKWTVNWQWN